MTTFAVTQFYDHATLKNTAHGNGVYIQFRMNTLHLRFKQVQQNMCHSPEVEDGVEN